MGRALVTKLLLLVILVFIVCLPEFFRISTVTKVNFFCLPYQHCEQRSRFKKGDSGRPENAEGKRKGICDLSQTADDEKWEQRCTQKNPNSLIEMWEIRDDPQMSWFTCETDANMDELHDRISASGVKMHFEASVWLQLNDTKFLTVTLNGLSNHSSVQPEEDEDQTGDGEGQTGAFYCCLPFLPTSKSTNQSHCLLWLTNKTVLTGTVMEKLPWKRTDEDEWCTIRVIWLALLCVVLLFVVTTVVRQIYFGKRLFAKPQVPPVGYHLSSQELNVGERQPDVTTSKARTTHQSFGLPSWSAGLPPIQEVDSQNEVETLLDGNADHCYSANLHHRGHPPTSAPTEDQVW